MAGLAILPICNVIPPPAYPYFSARETFVLETPPQKPWQSFLSAQARMGATAAKLDLCSVVPPRLARVLAEPCLHLLLLWALYMATRRPWGALTNVPASVFKSASIFLSALGTPRIALACGALAMLAAVCARWRWAHLEQGREMRIAYGALAILWVWLTAFMPYNLFFDHAWLFDRFVIVVLAGLVLWRPAFAPLLLAASLLFVAQQVPSIDRALNWTEKRIFLDIQIAFAAFLMLRRVLPVRSSTWLLLVLAVVGASYWVPFLNKMEIGRHFWSWALTDNLGNLFVAAHVDGFLPIADETALVIANWIGRVSPALGVLTICIECAGVFLFLHHRVARLVLVLFIGLHAGIFAASGILFYKWIVVEMGLIYVLWRQGPEIFAEWRWWMRLAGVALVVFSPITLKPYRLGWWDTKLSQVVRVEAVLKDGSVREVSPLAFKPYDLPFVQGKIRYALKHATVVGALGAADSEPSRDRIDKLDVEAATALIARGAVERSVPKAAEMDAFLRAFFSNANRYAGRLRPLWWLPAPPAHIWHDAVGKPWRGEHVVAIRLRAVDVLYDQAAHTLTTVGDEVAHQLEIPSNAKAKSPAPIVVGALHARAAAPALDRGSDMVFADACSPPAQDVVTLAILGDVALHRTIQQQTFAQGYGPLLEGVKPLVAGADMAWVNLEGTLGCCRDMQGGDYPDPGLKYENVVYSAENKTGLNFHVGLAAGLKEWGIDVVSTANNHALDRHRYGIGTTLDAFDAVHMPHTGTRRGPAEPWHTVTTSKGMTIAWLACTNWTNIKDPRATPYVLYCQKQRDEILALLDELSKANDAVVFLIHGGAEDTLAADAEVQGLAVSGAEHGATVVASYHPHTMQTWQKYKTTSGREVPFLWSRGNNITPVGWLEAVTSTIAFVGLAQGQGEGEKARAVGAVHVPIFIEDQNGYRRLIPIDGSTPMAAARSLAYSRFGRTRASAGVAPVDVRPDCSLNAAATPAQPWQNASGDLCTVDAECAEPLSCVATNNSKICTQACAVDADCPAAPGTEAVCVEDANWQTKVCLRRCKNAPDSDCVFTTGCEPRGAVFACVPGAPR